MYNFTPLRGLHGYTLNGEYTVGSDADLNHNHYVEEIYNIRWKLMGSLKRAITEFNDDEMKWCGRDWPENRVRPYGFF